MRASQTNRTYNYTRMHEALCILSFLSVKNRNIFLNFSLLQVVFFKLSVPEKNILKLKV